MAKCFIDSFRTLELNISENITSAELTGDYEAQLLISNNGDTYTFTAPHQLPLNKRMYLKTNVGQFQVHLGKVVRLPEFDERFASRAHYGAKYESYETTFTVWSPVAYHVDLILDGQKRPMFYSNGNWQLTVQGDLLNSTYMYGVYINHGYYEVIDPYAKGLTVNATAGVIVDSSVAPDGFDDHIVPKIKPKDSIIYEAHVRDFSMHPNSGMSKDNIGKFAGLIERGTTTNHGYSTGYDYVTSLGVTHLELLPINDFARVDDIDVFKTYNWGYDPMYFQTLDGSFSKKPFDSHERIKEFKEVVQCYHNAQMGIVLDVVFNHVYDRKTSSFNRLVPGYYFRYFDDLSVSNGTGVGNDYASERLMARQFIIDTILYYYKTFKVDGFRFDLMGTLDIETMRQIEHALCRENPYMLLLGEGWQLNTALSDAMKTTPQQSEQIPHIHFFNDVFRDILKGNIFDLTHTGFMTGYGKDSDMAYHLFRGEYFDMHVQQSINYTEVHDNHTLYDRIYYTSAHSDNLYAIHQMTTIFTILSQGVPFIHAGQEFFRTKFGHGNTYNLSDKINRIDWTRRAQFDDYVMTFKKVIALKRNFDIFKLENYEDITSLIIRMDTPHNMLGFLMFDRQYEWMIMFNPSKEQHTVQLPRQGHYECYLSNNKDLSSNQTTFNQYDIPPFNWVILRKEL